MARRYSNIKQGARLAQALTAYTTHLTTSATRVPNVGGGTARPPQRDLALTPFNVEVDTGEHYLARVSEPSRAMLGTAVGTAVQETSVSVTANKVPGYQPAKIIVFAGTGSATPETSNITGQRYLKYSGTSYSHPFGRAATTDREQSQFLRIKTALEAPNRRFSLRSEAIKQI